MPNEVGSFEVQGEISGKPKRKMFSLIVLVGIVSLIVAAAVAGYYFYDKAQKKAAAKAFLQEEGSSFSKVISQVNSLSTDKDVTDNQAGETIEVRLEKISDEELKVAKVLDEVRSTKKGNAERKSNDLVAGVDGLLDSFYSAMEMQLDTYHTFLTYSTEYGKATKRFGEEMGKLDTAFNNIKTDDDFLKAIDSRITVLKKYQSDISGLTPSPGMEDIQKKTVEHLERMVVIFSDLKSAVQAKNYQRALEVIKILQEFPTSSETKKYADDAKQMFTYYFDRQHSRFVDLQKQADAIKTEMMQLSFGFGVPAMTVTIEGW